METQAKDRRDRIARLCRALDEYLEHGCQLRESTHARLLRWPEFPSIYDANLACAIRASTEVEITALHADCDRHFAEQRHRHLICDALTPPEVEAHLSKDDWIATPTLELLLEGELRAKVRAADIRLAENDADWESIRLLTRANHEDAAERQNREPYAESLSNAMAQRRRWRAPGERTWIAREDGEDCAFLSSWTGGDEIGKVEDLFTLPRYRQRGIATALLANGVADVRANGGAWVSIGADPSETPKAIYVALGFRPIFVRRGYLRPAVPAS